MSTITSSKVGQLTFLNTSAIQYNPACQLLIHLIKPFIDVFKKMWQRTLFYNIRSYPSKF